MHVSDGMKHPEVFSSLYSIRRAHFRDGRSHSRHHCNEAIKTKEAAAKLTYIRNRRWLCRSMSSNRTTAAVYRSSGERWQAAAGNRSEVDGEFTAGDRCNTSNLKKMKSIEMNVVFRMDYFKAIATWMRH